MHHNNIIFSIFLIFAGAAVFSTLALYARQSLLIAYMLLGVLFGPWGLQVIPDVTLVQKTGDIGIIFLLFLIGSHMHPQGLARVFHKTAWIAIISSCIFFVVGFGFGYLCGFNLAENLIIGTTMTFSSTIVALKLLPSTIVQEQHSSELMIGILLIQDLIAVISLLLIHGTSTGNLHLLQIIVILISIPLVLFCAHIVERFVLSKLFKRFDRVREYMFLLSIAWCLGVAELAHLLGLSYEIGAFIAGISIAGTPIAFYITENLKPIRDFFLVLFFFSVGASFSLQYFTVIIVPAILLSSIYLLLKPITFRVLLGQNKETPLTSWEIGVRLGQISEFSLLVVYMAGRSNLVGDSVVYLVQAVTMIMFVTSSFFVVRYYRTPLMQPNAEDSTEPT